MFYLVDSLISVTRIKFPTKYFWYSCVGKPTQQKSEEITNMVGYQWCQWCQLTLLTNYWRLRRRSRTWRRNVSRRRGGETGRRHPGTPRVDTAPWWRAATVLLTETQQVRIGNLSPTFPQVNLTQVPSLPWVLRIRIKMKMREREFGWCVREASCLPELSTTRSVGQLCIMVMSCHVMSCHDLWLVKL